jgi:hypothetical protein
MQILLTLNLRIGINKSHSAVALAAPADLIEDNIDTTGLTQADLDYCDRFDRQWERRDCRESRRDFGPPRGCRDRGR